MLSKEKVSARPVGKNIFSMFQKSEEGSVTRVESSRREDE